MPLMELMNYASTYGRLSSFSFSSSGIFGGDLNQQVTRGYNIVLDGWAGAYNIPLTLHPHTHFTQSQPQHPKCVFSHFSTQALPTDRQTNGLTDGQSLL